MKPMTYPVLSWLMVWNLTMIVYEIEPNQTDFLLQEDIRLNLQIHNPDPQAVEVPDPTKGTNSQPAYALIGPPQPQEDTVDEEEVEEEAEEDPQPPQAAQPQAPPPNQMLFSNWSRHDRGQGLTPPAIQTMTVQPGETWKGQSRLNRLVRIGVPGEYRIASRLAFQGGVARAQDRTFRLNRPDPASLHVGQGERPQNVAIGQLVFLQRARGEGKQAAALYAIQFSEADPSNKEIEFRPAKRRADVAANATDVLSPWMNVSPFAELFQWIVWREGRTLRSISSGQKTPLGFDLPFEPDSLVRPPLKTKGGPVEVLAVKDRSLAMVTIPPQIKATASLAWRAELPAVPISITAALGTSETGSSRHVAMAARTADGVDILHGVYTPAGLGQFETAHIPGPPMLDKVPLAMAVTADGIARVGILRSDFSLVEVEFGGPGKPKVNITQLPKLEKPVTEGAIHYVTHKGVFVRREVVLSSDGDIWYTKPSGSLAKLDPRRDVASPIAVVPGQAVSFILYQEAKGGTFQFVALKP